MIQPRGLEKKLDVQISCETPQGGEGDAEITSSQALHVFPTISRAQLRIEYLLA